MIFSDRSCSKVSLVLNVLFSFPSLFLVVHLQHLPVAASWSQLRSGLLFAVTTGLIMTTFILSKYNSDSQGIALDPAVKPGRGSITKLICFMFISFQKVLKSQVSALKMQAKTQEQSAVVCYLPSPLGMHQCTRSSPWKAGPGRADRSVNANKNREVLKGKWQSIILFSC